MKPWRSKAPLILLTGSAGGGKSRLAAEKLHGCLLKYPKAQGLALRKTRESMVNSTVLFLEREIIGRTPFCNHVPSKHRFEYANGAMLAYGGMKDEEQREQIRSVGMAGGVNFALVEEAHELTRADFDELLARMRGAAAPWRQVVLSTNPAEDTHWINKDLIVGGGAEVYYSSAADNPANPPDYQAMLDRLTGVRRERLRNGKWVAAEGLVWDNYDPAVHLIDRFPIPPTWRRVRVVDFGYTNPFVCQWWALDDDGRAYRYREIYRTQRICEDHARQIVELSKGERIEATVADHDAEDRATLARHGIQTTPAVKAVSPGIQAVEARLRKAGDGKPRAFLLREALVEKDRSLEAAHLPTCTEEEITSYVWPKAADGKPVKEQPVKEHDHGCFAAGTMVATTRGEVPIEAVRPGDMVLTHAGYRRCLDAGITKPWAELWRLELSNGAHLRGTSDHLVWVVDRGWAPLDALRYGAILYAWSKQLPSTESSSGDTQTRSHGQKRYTSLRERLTGSAASADYTRKSGSLPMDRFRMGASSITRISIPSTTTYRTWYASQKSDIAESMPSAGQNEVGHQRCWSILRESDPRPRSGMPAQTDWSGIGSMGERSPVPEACSSSTVNIAGQLSSLSSHRRNGAPTTASPRHAGPRRPIMKNDSALSAGADSGSTAISRPGVVPVRVVRVCRERLGCAVYDLTIEDAHTFFANGILVHNCDAMRYFVQYLDAPRAKLPSFS